MRYNAQCYVNACTLKRTRIAIMENKLNNINHYLSFFSTGLIAVIIAFTSSVALIYQLVINLGGDVQVLASWLLALGVSMGVLSMGLSYFYKTPILIAWSTPGAALLIANSQGFTLNEAVAGFILSALLLTLIPLLLPLNKLFKWLPSQLCSAMLAGILLHFAIDLFTQVNNYPVLIISMFLCYLVCKQFAAQWALLAVLGVAILLSWQLQLIEVKSITWQLSEFKYTHPVFSWSVLTGISLPLFLITMAAQNLPGIAILNSFSYSPPMKPILASTGLVNLIAAPFGGYALNLAAITAAICMAEEVHPNPKQRFWASVCAGFLYLVMGVFSAYLMQCFALLPSALITALAGIALLATISHSLQQSLNSPNKVINEAAVITLLISASSISLWGVSSVIWALIGGGLVILLQGIHDFYQDGRAA